MQYNTVPIQPRLQQQQQQSSSMDLSSLLGIRIGQDTSGNFALTPAGLAVLGRDNRYYTMQYLGGRPRLVDVSALILPGDPGAYRMPVPALETGDLIVISDSPFQAMFVMESDGGNAVVGLDASCNEIVTYIPPNNPFTNLLFGGGSSVFVRVISTFDVLTGIFNGF